MTRAKVGTGWHVGRAVVTRRQGRRSSLAITGGLGSVAAYTDLVSFAFWPTRGVGSVGAIFAGAHIPAANTATRW